jgi:hypothetical protein
VPHGSKAELTLVLGQGAAIGIFAVTATRSGFPLRYYVVAGRSVIDLLLGGGVDLLRSEEYDRLGPSPTGSVDPERDRSRRSVVGQVEDEVDVVLAEGEVEGLNTASDAFNHRLDRCLPRSSTLFEDTFGALGRVAGCNQKLAHIASIVWIEVLLAGTGLSNAPR